MNSEKQDGSIAQELKLMENVTALFTILQLIRHGRNALVNVEPHVMTENVTVIYETTKNKTIVSSGQIGYITVIISHLGKDGAQKFTIPVYCEERNCAKNCQ